jgi:hypothetical protein
VQLNHVVAASAVPAISAGYVAVTDLAHKFTDQHTHVERASMGRTTSSEPSIQPRNGNDKKYIAQKKYNSNSSSSDYCWPSA